MNRMGLGLALGAGYVLGRTKKLKLAMAMGSLAAGRKMNLSPKGIADLVSQQLQNNPQVKELGDQLRQDLRGAGQAASRAVVERQMGALADRLHSRTGQVRDQLAGVVPGTSDAGDEREPAEVAGDDADDEAAAQDRTAEEESEKDEEASEPPREEAEKRGAKKAAARKAPGKKTAASKAPAKKAGTKKSAAKKTGGRATASAGAAARRAGEGQPKGGGDR
jgi:hypothetical protein